MEAFVEFGMPMNSIIYTTEVDVYRFGFSRFHALAFALFVDLLRRATESHVLRPPVSLRLCWEVIGFTCPLSSPGV